MIATPTLIAGLLWSAYCLATTGRPLPNTFYAKFDQGHPEGLITVAGEILWPLPACFAASGIVLYALGAWRVARAGWIVLAFPWLFLVMTAMSRSLPPGTGPFFYWSRYALPALPFLLIPIAAGWRWLWSVAATRRALGLQTPAVILLALTLVTAPFKLFDARQHYARNCQNIDELQVRAAAWVAQHVPPDQAVVVNDAGAMRYFGHRTTVDLVGLNDHTLVGHSPAHTAAVASPAGMRDFMQARGARHLVIFPDWYPAVTGAADFADLFEQVETITSEPYTVSPGGRATLVVYTCRDARGDVD
jgi:hypothetical protein